MKNFDITLMVKANSILEAEKVGKQALMDFAKTVGMRNGSATACCNGKAEAIFNGEYEVTATVSVDGNGNTDDIVKEVQRAWMRNAEIINSTIFVPNNESSVTEEKHEENPEIIICNRCGQVIVGGYETAVNKGTVAEYALCTECIAKMHKEDKIDFCECCGEWIDMDDIVENPVTHKRNICPVCGEIYDF